MGALAKVKPKKGRDYAKHAVDRLLAVVDDEDRAWLHGNLADPEVTAPTIAADVLRLTVPEYAPKLDYLYTVDLDERIRDWRNRNVA